MRKIVVRFGVVLLGLVGLGVAVVGVAGLVVVGSDDVLASPTTKTDLGQARAVVTRPGLLALRDARVTLTARADTGGAPFIGRAHPVDVDDWLKDVPLVEIRQASWRGLELGAVGAGGKAMPVDPRPLDFWAEQRSGPGTQSLTIRVDGSPTTAVVVPPKGARSLELSMGVRVPGLHRLAIVLTVVGVAVMALAILVGWWLRRRSRATPTAASPSTGAPGDDLAHDVDPATVPTGGAAPRPQGLQRAGRVVGVGLLTTLVAGCVAAPQRAPEWRSGEPRKRAVTEQTMGAVMADYDRRNNAAMAETARTGSPQAWARVDASWVLEFDRFDTAYEREAKEKEPVVSHTHVAERVYSAEFSSYPMVALVLGQVRYTKESAKQKGETDKAYKDHRSMWVMSRARAQAPWLQSSIGWVDRGALPDPAPPGATVTDADRKAVADARRSIVQQLSRGTSKGAPSLYPLLARRMAADRKLESFESWRRTSVRDWQIGGVPSEVVVPTRTGVIAIVEHDVTTFRYATDTMEWTDRAWARVTGQTGFREVLSTRSLVVSVVRLDRGQPPRMIGGQMSDLKPEPLP